MTTEPAVSWNEYPIFEGLTTTLWASRSLTSSNKFALGLQLYPETNVPELSTCKRGRNLRPVVSDNVLEAHAKQVIRILQR